MNIKLEDGTTQLLHAISSANFDIARYLIASGCNIKELNNDGVNAEVTTDDYNLIIANVHPFLEQPITCPYDIDRDSRVLYGDSSCLYGNYTSEAGGNALLLITPVVSNAMPMAVQHYKNAGGL